MAVYYLGDPKFRQYDANGSPLAGGKLYTYEPGTSTPKTAYTDQAQTTPHANPIILDGNGQAEIWLEGLYKLKLDDSADVEQWTMDQVHGVGYQAATAAVDEWTERTETPTHIDNTNFSVPGDLRTTYSVGRRNRATIGAGTVYGTITASVFTTVTTITLVLDSGTLDSGLSAVAVGFLSSTNPSIPGVELSEDDYTFQGDVTVEGSLAVTGTLNVTGRLTADGVLPPGATCYSFLASMSGWLLVRGQTLGSAASGADDASDSYDLVYAAIWDNVADAEAPVSSGRGASAAADFAANKTITLPDGRGVVLLGKDNMGGSSANVVTDAQADTMGDLGGAEDATLATTNLPAHAHGMAHTHGAGTYAGVWVSQNGAGSGAGVIRTDPSIGNPVNIAVTISGTSGASSASSTDNTGSGTAFSIKQPYMTQNLFVRY